MVDRRVLCLDEWRTFGMIFLCAGIVLLVSGCSPNRAEARPDKADSETSQSVESQSLSAVSPVRSPLATPISTPISTSPVQYGYEVIAGYPHDPTAWTQGLVYADGIFYEGTGLVGQSTLRRVEPWTGEVLSGVRLSDELFGEGITVLNDKIYALTWKAQTGFVVDKESFELLDTFSYPTEGWGLTHDGKQLIMSDGTNRLFFRDPETLAQTGAIEVFDGEEPVVWLNELEYVEGKIYANVWQTEQIAIIDPASGRVTGWIDLSGLLPLNEMTEPVDVLNGIAYDDDADRLFVTGKLWPTLFEIRLIPID